METNNTPPIPWTRKDNRLYAADGEEIVVATNASPKYRKVSSETAEAIRVKVNSHDALIAARGTLAQSALNNLCFRGGHRRLDWTEDDYTFAAELRAIIADPSAVPTIDEPTIGTHSEDHAERLQTKQKASPKFQNTLTVRSVLLGWWRVRARDPALDCGHQFTGQGRCGKCNRCYSGCCVCAERKRAPQRKPIARPLPAPDPYYAQVLDTSSAIGRTTVRVLCTCGKASWHYLWSWAGHGKTRCDFCEKWIDYRSLRVFTNIDELRHPSESEVA